MPVVLQDRGHILAIHLRQPFHDRRKSTQHIRAMIGIADRRVEPGQLVASGFNDFMHALQEANNMLWCYAHTDILCRLESPAQCGGMHRRIP